jgi:UDP-2,4-diacetamido-2,4,6-trideoxy-beta-L-altropyranose hydrolase
MDAPRILFVCDAGPEVGGGHVMRSLTLARALAERGGRPAFLATPAAATVLAAFAPGDIGRIAGDPDRLVEDAARATAGFDALVIDHYGLDADAHRTIAQGRPALIIDDLADRPLAGDLILDPAPDRTSTDFAGLVSAEARLLLGASYALVRPEFATLRSVALERRAEGDPVGRVLVSLGLTDVGGITARVVNRVLPRLGDAALDVVLGSEAPSREAMERVAARDDRVRVLTNVADMAALTADADLAVGAGGATAWERCVLGLPAVLAVLADNQAPIAASLAKRGAVEAVDARAPDFDAAFDRAFTGLMRSAEARTRMSKAAAALCDGLGAGRVADAFLAVIAAR